VFISSLGLRMIPAIFGTEVSNINHVDNPGTGESQYIQQGSVFQTWKFRANLVDVRFYIHLQPLLLKDMCPVCEPSICPEYSTSLVWQHSP